MENASQALIIAGAILLAILLIAIGMFIFNKANDSIQKSAQRISSEDVKAFNAKIEPYVGTRVSGTEVKALLSEAAIIAQTQETAGVAKDADIRLKITLGSLNKETTSSRINQAKNAIKDLQTFSVVLGYQDSQVNEITITQVNN